MAEREPIKSNQIGLEGTGLIEPKESLAPKDTNLIELSGKIILLSPGGIGPTSKQSDKWVTHTHVPTAEDWAIVDKRREELLSTPLTVQLPPLQENDNLKAMIARLRRGNAR
jgi:hypothetical protein